MKKFLKNLFLLFALSAFTGGMIAFTSRELPIQKAFAKPEPKTGRSAPKIMPLSLPDVIQMFYNPNNLFLDIRERKHYEYGHIAGAINIPAGEIDNCFAGCSFCIWRWARSGT